MRLFFAALIFCVLTPGIAHAQAISYDNAVLQFVDDVKVASLDPGVVESLNVQPGDQVKKGDILLKLDSDIYESEAKANRFSWLVAMQEAKNDVNLRFSQKTLELNQKQLEKSLAAVAQYAKSISETEIDRLRLERDQSELSIEQAAMEKETAELNVQLREEQKKASEIRLQRREVTSPLDGMVVEVAIQKGEAVTSGQPVLRVVNLNKLRVKAPFDVEHVFQMNKDLVVYFEIDVKGKTKKFPAKIVFVDPEIRTTEKKFLVWADIDNTSRELLPGFKGRLVIGL